MYVWYACNLREHYINTATIFTSRGLLVLGPLTCEDALLLHFQNMDNTRTILHVCILFHTIPYHVDPILQGHPKGLYWSTYPVISTQGPPEGLYWSTYPVISTQDSKVIPRVYIGRGLIGV